VEENKRKHQHAQLAAEIACYEWVGDANLPPARTRQMAELRYERSEREDADPTSVMLEQKRANASLPASSFGR